MNLHALYPISLTKACMKLYNRNYKFLKCYFLLLILSRIKIQYIKLD